MDDDRRVEEPPASRSGAPTTSTGNRARETHDELGDRPLDRVEQRILQQQIVDRVGRQPELGEDHERSLDGVPLLGEAEVSARFAFTSATRVRGTHEPMRTKSWL